MNLLKALQNVLDFLSFFFYGYLIFMLSHETAIEGNGKSKIKLSTGIIGLLEPNLQWCCKVFQAYCKVLALGPLCINHAGAFRGDHYGPSNASGPPIRTLSPLAMPLLPCPYLIKQQQLNTSSGSLKFRNEQKYLAVLNTGFQFVLITSTKISELKTFFFVFCPC